MSVEIRPGPDPDQCFKRGMLSRKISQHRCAGRQQLVKLIRSTHRGRSSIGAGRCVDHCARGEPRQEDDLDECLYGEQVVYCPVNIYTTPHFIYKTADLVSIHAYLSDTPVTFGGHTNLHQRQTMSNPQQHQAMQRTGMIIFFSLMFIGII